MSVVEVSPLNPDVWSLTWAAEAGKKTLQPVVWVAAVNNVGTADLHLLLWNSAGETCLLNVNATLLQTIRNLDMVKMNFSPNSLFPGVQNNPLFRPYFKLCNIWVFHLDRAAEKL